MLELLIGQIPEAIFFALFMIYAKGLKEKRILFVILMVVEYLLLKRILSYNVWFQILYTFMTFVILKILYKEKSQIIDIFTFTIASLIMGIIESILYFIIWKTINNYIIFVILVKFIYILFFTFFHNKLYKIQDLYKKLWNRKINNTIKMKSATFRCINIVSFNIIFYLINLCMIFMNLQNGGVDIWEVGTAGGLYIAQNMENNNS